MYMSQDVFDASALALAITHFSGINRLQVAGELAARLSKTYSDSEIFEELMAASEQVIDLVPKLLNKSEPNASDLAGVCDTLFKAISKYDEKGKRRRKIFSGAWFSKPREQIMNKPKNTVKNIVLYHIMIMNGNINPMTL